MRYTHLFTAAALSASALLYVNSVNAADTVVQEKTKTTFSNPNDAMNTAEAANLQLPAGIAQKDLNADKSIEKTLAAITNDAMSKTGFDNLVSYLNDQDKDRVKKSTDKSLNNLDGNKNKALTDVIANLDGAFKTHYNAKFDLNYKNAYNADFLKIVTGEVTDPNQLVGQWPVPAGMNAPRSGELSPQDAAIANNKAFGGRVNLEKGRNVAIAHLKGFGNLPGLTASLIHEGTGYWHVDIPNDINAQQLYDNLVANLTYMNNNQNSWPNDINETYRQFTGAVVAAMYNIRLDNAQPSAINR